MERKFSEQEIIRREKAKQLKAWGVEPFGYKMDATHSSKQFLADYNKYSKEELSSQQFATVTLVGRIRSKRGPFISLKDHSGDWQAYVPKKELDELTEKLWNQSDIGDLIAITGTPMKTSTGVLSVRLTKYHHLVKALKPLPDDYYGLQDIEERYRRRYVDLIMRPDVRETFKKRSAIMKYLREFLDARDYLEVETPILQPTIGGASARPFSTHHNALDTTFFLRIATELPLKRCIVGGIPRVYEIGRLFRNEGMDATHNPEFTTVELYEAYSDLKGMMELTQSFISKVTKKITGSHKINYQGRQLNLAAPFKSIHMVDFVKQETGVDFWEITDIEKARIIAKEHGVKVEPHHNSVGYLVNSFFEAFCEHKVTDPVFVYGYPVEISPLAIKSPDNERFAERFELFIDGKEFANAFSELNDPIDQYARFNEQLRERSQGNNEAQDMDIDFIEAIEYGMPPTGGLGIGLDRLVMLLTDSHSIRDVLLFPHMRPRG